MRLSFLISCFFYLSYCNCQQLITSDSSKFRKGFYRDFYEFKYNKPSVPFDNIIDSVKLSFGGQYDEIYNVVYKEDNKHTYYTIIIKSHQRKILQGVFGFCDGTNIYISFGDAFEKISYLGRFSTFRHCSKDLRLLVPLPFGGVGFVNLKKGIHDFVIDLNTGKFISLNVDIVSEILKGDTTLHIKFNSDKSKKENLVNYIIDYSKSHNDLLLSRDEYTTGDIVDFLDIHETDLTMDIYYNRIINELPKM